MLTRKTNKEDFRTNWPTSQVLRVQVQKKAFSFGAQSKHPDEGICPRSQFLALSPRSLFSLPQTLVRVLGCKYWSILRRLCEHSAIWRSESAVHMDATDNGRLVARRHSDARVRGRGVACTAGHVAASWRTTSGQQTSICARSVHYNNIRYFC